ncbi:MAG: hypothetical protein H6Q68_1846 [Firmicutes bacterium]|nr:hypothetical protein [Bacillota bacterium]
MRNFFGIPRWFCVVAVVLFLVSVSPVSFMEGKGGISQNLPLQDTGKKFRIAYFETRPYVSYAGTFYYVVQGLKSLGWLENINELPYKEGQVDTKEMWNWLSSHNVGSKIEFVKDGYYSLKDDNVASKELLKRLSQDKDIDLIIVMGTVAAKAIANEQHSVPVMVFSTSNAVQSGIVEQTETSGNPHIWAHMDPNRYRQQLEVFYDIFKFKKLGFVYDPSPTGQAFAAVEDIKYVAAAEGFTIRGYEIQGTKNEEDQERFANDLLALHKKIASEVDAVYYTVTPSPGLKPEKLEEILTPFYEQKIPVFSQLGEEVPRGALLSVARPDLSGVGMFGAEQITNVFKGQSIDKLPQVYVDAPAIAINMEVARKIGYQVPFDILLVADKVYQSVKR